MITRRYHGPPAKVQAQRMAAAKQALDDLAPDERAAIDDMMFRLCGVNGAAEYTAIEIVAALAMICGGENA